VKDGNLTICHGRRRVATKDNPPQAARRRHCSAERTEIYPKPPAYE